MYRNSLISTTARDSTRNYFAMNTWEAYEFIPILIKLPLQK